MQVAAPSAPKLDRLDKAIITLRLMGGGALVLTGLATIGLVVAVVGG